MIIICIMKRDIFVLISYNNKIDQCNVKTFIDFIYVLKSSKILLYFSNKKQLIYVQIKLLWNSWILNENIKQNSISKRYKY